MSLSQVNPVLDLELRQRSRRIWSLIVLLGFLLFAVGILVLAYEGEKAGSAYAYDPVAALSQNIGRSMVEWVLACELGVLLLVVPGISAASVASERSRQTLIPLQITLLRPWQIYSGKVLASSAFVLLLLVVSMPVLAVPYLIGGVSIGGIVAGVGSALFVGVVYSAIGVACSTVFRRVQTAILAAYTIVAVFTVGAVVALVATIVVDQSRGSDNAEPVIEVLYPSPLVFVASVTGDNELNGGSAPLSALRHEMDYFRRGGAADTGLMDGGFEEGAVFVGDGPVEFVADEPVGDGGQPEPGPRRTWLWSGLAQLALLGVASVVGVRRLQTPQAELDV
ncbi:MAG: ABC transporter permease [Acidimicrobiales bacterium]